MDQVLRSLKILKMLKVLIFKQIYFKIYDNKSIYKKNNKFKFKF